MLNIFWRCLIEGNLLFSLSALINLTDFTFPSNGARASRAISVIIIIQVIHLFNFLAILMPNPYTSSYYQSKKTNSQKFYYLPKTIYSIQHF